MSQDKNGRQRWFIFFSKEKNKLDIEMTLILFLSLGISNKNIASEGLIKGLCGQLYVAGVKSGYGRRAFWLNNSCFLSAKLAVLFGESKNQHYARFIHVLWLSVEVSVPILYVWLPAYCMCLNVSMCARGCREMMTVWSTTFQAQFLALMVKNVEIKDTLKKKYIYFI